MYRVSIWIIGILALLALAAGISGFFWGLPDLLGLTSVAEYVKFWGLILGGLSVFWGLMLNNERVKQANKQLENSTKQLEIVAKQVEIATKQSEIAERGQIGTRFKDAALLLADDRTSANLSGVCALHQIAKEVYENGSQRSYIATILDILCAYIRENYSVENKNPQKDRVILQTIVDKLFKAEGILIYKRLAINLYRVDLSKLNLHDANLSYANLSYANLPYANLSRTDLFSANLSGAQLSFANLSGTDFSCAELLGADFSCAELLGADLSCADLSCAELTCAKLLKVDLSAAVLSGASLFSASFSLESVKSVEIRYGGEREIVTALREYPKDHVFEDVGSDYFVFAPDELENKYLVHKVFEGVRTDIGIKWYTLSRTQS